VTVSFHCSGRGYDASSISRDIASTFDAMALPKSQDMRISPSVGVGIIDPDDIGKKYCCGVIGKGNKFCLESPEECTVLAHSNNRIELSESSIFIGSTKVFD